MKKLALRIICLMLCAAMLLGEALVPGVVSLVTAVENTSENLLTNGSFETSATSVKDWNMFSTQTQAVYTEEKAHGGNLAVAISATEASKNYGIKQRITGITAGAEYNLTAFTWSEGETKAASTRHMLYKFYDAENTLLVQDKKSANQISGWVEHAITVTAPENAVSLEIIVYAPSTASATVYIDDISVVAAGNDANLVANGDFETNIADAGWTVANGGGAYISTNKVTAADGSNVLALNTLDTQVFSAAVAVESGKIYEASVQAYGVAETTSYDLLIQFLDASEAVVNQYSANKTPALNSWETLTVATETIPAGATKVRVALVAKGTSSAWYMDKATLTSKDAPNSSQPNPNNPPVLEDESLLANASFEMAADTLEGWKLFSTNTAVTYVTSSVHSGQMAGVYSPKTVGSQYGISQKVPVTGGTEYNLTAYTWAEGEVKADCARTMLYKFYDANGKQVGGSARSSKNQIATWIEHALTVTAPADATTLEVIVYSAGTAKEAIHVDDVSVVATGSDVNLVVNGGFETLPAEFAGWTVVSGGSAGISTAITAAHGSQVLLASAPNTQVLSDPIALQDWKLYDASVQVYGTSAGSSYELAVRYLDNDGNVVGQSVKSKTPALNTWETITVETNEIPVLAVSVQVALTAKGTGEAWYFDDADLVMKDDSNTPDDDYTVMVPEQNLIRNPYFELTTMGRTHVLEKNQAPVGWTIVRTTGIAITDTERADGQWSLYINDESTEDLCNIKTTIPNIQAGKDYTVAFQYKGKAQVNINFYDANGKALKVTKPDGKTANEYRHYMSTRSDWGLSAVSGNIAPEGAVSATVAFATLGSGTASYYVDDAQFYLTEDAAKTNLMTNGSFEDHPSTMPEIPIVKKTERSLSGWSGATNANLVKTQSQTDKEAVGNYMLHMVDNSEKTGYLASYTVDAEENAKYTFSSMVRGEYSYSAPQLMFQFYSDDECKNRISYTKTNVDVSGGNWVLGSYTATAPEGAKKMTVSLASANLGLGWAYFGNVSLVKDMNNRFLNLNMEFVEGTSNKPQSWVGLEDGEITIAKNPVFAGSNSLKVTDSSTEKVQGALNEMIVLSGYHQGGYATNNMTYTLTARIKDAVGTKGRISLVFYDGTFQKCGEISAESAGTGEWQFVVAQEVAPATATFAELHLEVGTDAAATGTVYFDDMTLFARYDQFREEPYDWEIKYDEGNRLFFNDKELAEMKEWIKDDTVNSIGVSGKATYEKLISQAETYLNKQTIELGWDDARKWSISYKLDKLRDTNLLPEFDHNPGRIWPYLEGLSGNLQEYMQVMSLAYALSGDTRYADRVISWAMDICEWEYWYEYDYAYDHNKNNGNLDHGHILAAMAAAYDMCYNRMTPEQREIISQNILYKGLQPSYLDITCADRFKYNNKWMCRNGAMMSAALAIVNEENKDDVSRYLDRSLAYSKWYLDSLYDNMDQEGYSYTRLTLEQVIGGWDSMLRVTGRDGFIDHPYIQEVVVDWVVDLISPSKQHPVYGRSFYGPFYHMTMGLLTKYGNGKAGYYLKEIGMTNEPYTTLLYTARNPVITEPTEKDYVVYSPLGYGGMRTDFTEDAMMLYLLGNDTGLGTGQFDQLSFQLASGKIWLATDPGYERYAFHDGIGHNTIAVDGEAQSVSGNGTLSPVVDGKLYGQLSGSAPGAYGEGTLDTFDRHGIMINHADKPYYIIIDNLASQDKHTFEWSLFTSGWTALEVDQKPLEKGSTTGKNVSVFTKTGGMLFAEFVSKNPLNVRVASYEDGGTMLHAGYGATTNAQYMTILSKSYGDGGNQEYSFLHLLNNLDKVNYKTSSKESEITKAVTVQGIPLFFFRGYKPGDYIEFPFEVEEGGTFDVSLRTAKNFNYGIYKIYIDGKYINSYDGFDPKVQVHFHELGKMNVSAGKHTLRLEVVGTNSTLDQMLISVNAIIFSKGSGLESPTIYTQEVYDTNKVLGAKIYHNDYNSDIVLFNRDGGTIVAGGVTTDAQQASIIALLKDGTISEGFAAVKATNLSYKGIQLMKAEKPATVSADYRGKASFTVTTDVAQKISLYAASSILGVTVNGKNVEFTRNGKMATISLAAGTYDVVLKVSSATEIKYLPDGGIITTTYDQNGKIIREHIQNADGTEKLTEYGKVIVHVYVDKDTKRLVREELSPDGTLTITRYDAIGNIAEIEIRHPDGRVTTIKYLKDGSISTTTVDEKGETLEVIMEYPDGTKTKAEYREDATITTKYDANGNIISIITLYKGGKRVEEIYDENGNLIKVITQGKGGTKEEVVYNADGTVVTTTYLKGKLVSVRTQNADGTVVLVEYLEDGGVRTTNFDANGNIVDALTVYKDGSYIKYGFFPTMISGEGQKFYGFGNMVFVSDDDIVNFKAVTVNGEVISSDNYTVEEGSIRVTLNKEYLKSLPMGTYTLGIVSTHGEVTTEFVIGISVWVWIGIGAAVLAGGTVAAVLILKKKKKEEQAPANA